MRLKTGNQGNPMDCYQAKDSPNAELRSFVPCQRPESLLMNPEIVEPIGEEEVITVQPGRRPFMGIRGGSRIREAGNDTITTRQFFKPDMGQKPRKKPLTDHERSRQVWTCGNVLDLIDYEREINIHESAFNGIYWTPNDREMNFLYSVSWQPVEFPTGQR